jgi:hypothetical protein
MEAAMWLKENAGERDIVAHMYVFEPLSDLSGGGNNVFIQEYTHIPTFGGAHFESSRVTQVLGRYDTAEFFERNTVDTIHHAFVKFNTKYIVVDNNYYFMKKILIDPRFKVVFENGFLFIVELTESNDLYINQPEQNGIQVLSHDFKINTIRPRLTWKINNTEPNNIMTLSISYFPKWSATINGSKTSLNRNHDLMIYLPLLQDGEQTITIEYKNTVLEIFFSCLSFLVFLFILIIFIRRIIINRGKILLFQGTYWQRQFSGILLRDKIILLSFISVGILIIFLSLTIGFGDITSGPPVLSANAEEVNYVNSAWLFSYKQRGRIITNSERIILRADGRIVGLQSDAEYTWGMEDKFLVFYNINKKPTTRFTKVVKNKGKYVMEGDFLLRGGVVHILEQR